MVNGQRAYVACRVTIALVWLYHGLVPKLLGPHEDELAMNMALGLSLSDAHRLAQVAGVLEIGFGVTVLICWQQRWPLLANTVMMIALLVFVAIAQPELMLAAFNPLTTNLSVCALGLVALQLHAQKERS